jgi:integrase
MSTFLQILKETGMRSGEAWQLKWNDIDFETNNAGITPEKGSNPQIIHISKKLISMLTKSSERKNTENVQEHRQDKPRYISK